MMSEHRYGVHDCPNGLYYLRDVTDHSVYVHRNYGKLYSEYEDDIKLVSTLLNELADKVDEQQATIKYLTIEKHQENKRFQTIIAELKKENEQLKEELNNLKKDETMLYHYYTLARYSGDGV